MAVGKESAPGAAGGERDDTVHHPRVDENITAAVPRRPAAATDSAFVPGDTVAGRYYIKRFIAFGGMGEVYEAEDVVLRQPVALKTIRADVADDEVINDRFKREILLARKVTHVNVCRIFDLGLHSPSDGRPPQTFLSMELLHGESLADRLKMGRPFSVDEARPVVEQMVAALEAAHREGIVHRDFKSGNVMLCTDEKQGGVRTVVTDFGLARGGDADPFASTATGSTGLLGSPAYMAPEQVEGGHVDKAADIYALGIVMFEMLTGEVPFKGESAMSCAVKRIKGPAPSPRELLPELDALWERTILRCLERDPENRFASARDVVRSLDGEVAPQARHATADHAPVPPPPSPARSRWPRVLLAILALAISAAAIVLVARREPPVGQTPPAVTGGRRAVAVLGFKNLSHREDVAWLSTALGEMLTTELGAGGELRTIPGESVARMKTELSVEDAESYARDTLAAIRKNVGADFVLVGSYVPLGDRFRLDVRLQETATGETLAQIRDTGTQEEMAALVERIGAQLRDQLRVGKLDEAEVAIVHAALPRGAEAARAYAEGLAKLRLFAAADARTFLERAIELEPGFPQAHAALAEALSYLGYEARARDVAHRALELAAQLPEEERLRVEGVVHGINGDTARAAEAYRRLFEKSPDNLEWGMRLAGAQYSMGQEEEGEKTVARLRTLPEAAEDPRIYLVLMQAAMMKARFDEVRELAARLAASGEARGALSLVGESKGLEAMALWFQGELASSVTSAEQARELAFRLGDRDGVAGALTTKAFVLTEMGRFADAHTAALAALDVAAEVGSRRRIWLAEHVLARCGLWRGDLAEANRRYEASRRSAVDLGSRYGEALGQLGIAVTAAAQGELARAEPIYERMSLGFRLFAPKRNQAFFRYWQGTLQLAEGELAGARESFAAALALSEEFKERVQTERARVGLAQVALLEGKAAESEEHARKAQVAFAELALPDDRTLASLALLRALLALGRVAEGTAMWGEATLPARASESIFVRYAVARGQGEVHLAAGDAVAALKEVEPALEDSATRGYIGEALELRLLRGMALRAANRGEEARRELAAVDAEARRLGFARVADRARATVAAK